MELTHKQSLEFKEAVLSSLNANASQSWLNSLQLLKITPAKVVITGIPHKIYLYEIKTNHEKLLRKVLDKLYPDKAPFSEKKFIYSKSLRQTTPITPKKLQKISHSRTMSAFDL